MMSWQRTCTAPLIGEPSRRIACPVCKVAVCSYGPYSPGSANMVARATCLLCYKVVAASFKCVPHKTGLFLCEGAGVRGPGKLLPAGCSIGCFACFWVHEFCGTVPKLWLLACA